MKSNDVSTDREQYRHKETYRVRYDDLDTYRHVNNKAFLAYVEDARIHYFSAAAQLRNNQTAAHGAMVVHASIDYRAQIQPFEEVDVYTRCARLGSSSMTLHHLILAGPERRIAATSTTILAAVDFQTGKSMPVPEETANRIVQWEPVDPERG